MKLVAVSRVKDEIDVIEAFVRHHAAQFDEIVVHDDGSNDGTWQALRSLQQSGLPLVLLRDPSLGQAQSHYMTRLARHAVEQRGADWVAPLDADEFIEAPEGTTLREVLQAAGPVLLKLGWTNFAWRAEDDQNPEPNPVVRLRVRMPVRADMAKVLVPASLLSDPAVAVAQGNHDLVREGRKLPAQGLESVRLCHFPVRSLSQYATKVAIGYLKYATQPHWQRDLGFHYIEPFRVLAAGIDQLGAHASVASRRYSAAGGTALVDEPTLAPLRYQGGPLTLKAAREPPLASVLHFAESIADRLAAVSRGQESLEQLLRAATPLLADAAPAQRILALQETALQAGEAQRAAAAAERDARAGQAACSEALAASQAELAAAKAELAAARTGLATASAELAASRAEAAASQADNAQLTARVDELQSQAASQRRAIAVQQNQLSSRTVKLVQRLHDMVERRGIRPDRIADQLYRLIRID